MSIIEELYYGNISPCEKYIKKDSEYEKVNKQLIENIELFISCLNTKEKQLFEKIENTFLNANEIAQKESFIDGFCIGARMIMEIMNFSSSNFADL